MDGTVAGECSIHFLPNITSLHLHMISGISGKSSCEIPPPSVHRILPPHPSHPIPSHLITYALLLSWGSEALSCVDKHASSGLRSAPLGRGIRDAGPEKSAATQQHQLQLLKTFPGCSLRWQETSLIVAGWCPLAGCLWEVGDHAGRDRSTIKMREVVNGWRRRAGQA